MIDPPAAGTWNMAVDEALMEWAAATGRCCWRFYRWQQATLSLGYFQEYGDRRQHAASQACPVVRRPSGGGAIVHHFELTYSFAVPRGHPLAAQRLALYETIHRTLIEVLAAHGVPASLCDRSDRKGPGRQPFLCFQRRSPGDVLVGTVKVAGSAQRRSAGAVLQHGSVLLARSPAAPELAGLNDVANSPLPESRLIEAWLDVLGQRLAVTWENQPLAEPRWQAVAKAAEAKYASQQWTTRQRR